MGLAPYLSQIVTMLVPKLEDPRPMVRVITCWALGRCGAACGALARDAVGQGGGGGAGLWCAATCGTVRSAARRGAARCGGRARGVGKGCAVRAFKSRAASPRTALMVPSRHGLRVRTTTMPLAPCPRRYAQWVLMPPDAPAPPPGAPLPPPPPANEALFGGALRGVLGRVADRNRAVQQAACSALAVMQEHAGAQGGKGVARGGGERRAKWGSAGWERAQEMVR